MVSLEAGVSTRCCANIGGSSCTELHTQGQSPPAHGRPQRGPGRRHTDITRKRLQRAIAVQIAVVNLRATTSIHYHINR